MTAALFAPYTPTPEDIANSLAEDAWKARRRAADLKVLQARLAAEHHRRVDACIDAHIARTAGATYTKEDATCAA